MIQFLILTLYIHIRNYIDDQRRYSALRKQWHRLTDDKIGV